jgi:HK97 gp10 family phage protein
MKVNVHGKGVNVLKTLPKKIKQFNSEMLHTLGMDLVIFSKKLMQQTKHGRQYRVYKQRKIRNQDAYKTIAVEHTAADDGEAPGIITGALIRSLQFEQKGNDALTFGVEEDSFGVDYAKYLEDGTKKMEKKPFLNPSIKKNTMDFVVRYPRFLQKFIDNSL